MKLIIGFDGLHRSGKGTQISLVQNQLSQNNIACITARGDGTRRGSLSSSFDYSSAWWRERWDYFQDKSNPNSVKDNLNVKFQRLNREARMYFGRTLEQEMKKINSETGLMLLDRTLPSRYATMRSFYPEITFEESIQSYNPKNGLLVPPIIPGLTFIMHAPQEVLLRRVRDTTFSEKDFHCKTNVVTNYYSLFAELLDFFAQREGYFILDSTKDPKELNDFIWTKISQKLKE